MPARFGFHIGPFYFSQRVGRTQAQKRAAAKQGAQRAAAKAEARHMGRPETQAALAAAHARNDRTYTGPVAMSGDSKTMTVTDSLRGRGDMTISALDDRFALLHDGDVVRLTVNENGTGLEAFEHLWYANGRNASQKSPLNMLRSKERARLFEPPPSPEEVAAREAAKADHDARTHRYRVTAYSIDAIKGGEFTLEAEDLDSIRIRLDAKSAVHFLSLKAGDIVQVTLAPGNAGLEKFWQLSRANGAKPRSPVELTAADMERLGLTANRSESGG